MPFLTQSYRRHRATLSPEILQGFFLHFKAENNILKTSACIHETDDNRNCEKNGPHCAFGHGHDDLRAPIFDASVGGSGEVEIMERLPNTSEDKVTFMTSS